jgi:hypothetical protein
MPNPPVPIGINADAKFLKNTGAFLNFARDCGSVVVIDDNEWKLLPVLRANNPTQILISRYHYDGAEGRWRDIEYDGKPQTAKRMFDVLTAGYRPELDVWVYMGNEPARGNDPQKPDELKRDIEFYCEVVRLCVQNKVRVVVQNIQITELRPENIATFKPLFELCHLHPQYVAFGIHQYFTLLLALGVGGGDWSKLLKWGSHPRSQWANYDGLKVNALNAHIGRDYWLRQVLNGWGYTNVRLFGTEMGFDRINNIPQIEALDNANGGRKVRGLQTILDLLLRHEPTKDPLQFAAEQIIWMSETITETEVHAFYNWSVEPAWYDYTCSEFPTFRALLVEHNRKLRQTPTVPPTTPNPPIPTPTPITPPFPMDWRPTIAPVQRPLLALAKDGNLHAVSDLIVSMSDKLDVAYAYIGELLAKLNAPKP